jgi:hypothetical protein
MATCYSCRAHDKKSPYSVKFRNSTSHLYRKGLDSQDYIRLSGGLTRKADNRRIYVVRADGSVVANMGGGWFRRGSRVVIQTGRHDRRADRYRPFADLAAVANRDDHRLQRCDRR